MSVKSKPKSLHSLLTTSTSCAEADDEAPCPIAAEIEALRKSVLRNSPGGAMLVRKLEALDQALVEIWYALRKSTLDDHHRGYVADRASRRLVYLKTSFDLSILDHVRDEIERRVQGFDLTDATQPLSPVPEKVRHALEWRRRYLRDKAREAQSERAARGSRTNKAKPTSPGSLARAKRRQQGGEPR